MRILMIMTLLLISVNVLAQEPSTPPPITAENTLQLESVHQIDFDTDIYVPTLSPEGQDTPLDVEINVGWFVYSSSSDRFLVMGTSNSLQTFFSNGASTYSEADVDLIDAVAFKDGFYALLLSYEDGFSVWYENFTLYGGSGLHINVSSDAIPSAIWVTCPDITEFGIGCSAHVEGSQGDSTIVLTMPVFDVYPGGIDYVDMLDSDLEQQIYAPSTDTDAVVRIGRIPLPYVVTSSQNGIVKLWNLDTGEIVYEVDNGTGEPSVFGNINKNATHLVWRDNDNETLYLLDFETGKNREIAALNGEYAQWYFISNDASVIIAVNLGGKPNIVVWDTTTGERTDLGNYRNCERPQPDMARLTEDGSTLIIGCDTGLDIWRVK